MRLTNLEQIATSCLVKVMLVTCLVVITGCVTPATVLSVDEKFGPDEGGLVFRIHSAYYNTRISFSSVDGNGPRRVRTKEFDGGLQLLAIKLPAGVYRTDTIYAGGAIFSGRLMQRTFEVKPGELGYIGDLYLMGQDSHLNMSVNWTDEQTSTEEHLRSIAPGLLANYPFDYAVLQE